MLKLLLNCPHCKKNQKWISYRITRRSELRDRRRKCVVCERSFRIRDNLVKELEYFG